MNKRDFIRGVGVGVLATSIVVGCFSLAGLGRAGNPQNDSSKNHIATENPLDKETDIPEDTAGPAQTADVTADPLQSPAPEASGAPASETPEDTRPSDMPGTTGMPASSEAPASSAGQNGQTSGGSAQTAAPSAGQNGQTPGGNTQTAAGSSSGMGSSPAATKEPAPDPAGKYTLEIPGGTDSYTVASRLEDAGIVSSAREFDDYLVERGYSEKLAQGSFEISKGDTYDQIARKITGRVK